jgi:integrase
VGPDGEDAEDLNAEGATSYQRYVIPEHFAAMLAAAEQMAVPDIPNVTPAEYWRAVISFAFVTGWRINEVLNIRRDDVNFGTGQVIARWDDSKDKRDELIYVPDSLLDLLRNAWKNFADRPLEWTKSRRTLYVPFA